MNSLTIKLTAFAISLFIVIMVVSQLYNVFSDKEKYEQAVLYTVNDSLSFEGICVRNEKVIPFDGKGVLNYPNSDGSKIAKNSVVAQVYSDSSQVESLNEIERLKEELSLISRSINTGTVSAAQPEFISKQIDEKYLLLQNYIENNDIDKIASTKKEILVLMNIYSVATNAENGSSFIKHQQDINSRITELNRKLGQPISTITTKNSGYFVNYTDGFESKLNFETIKSITPEEIKKILSSSIQKNSDSVGKIIDDYKWKIVGVVSSENNYIEKKTINIKINGITENIPAYVESMTSLGNGKYKIIMSCDYLNYDLVQDRVRHIDIIFNEYSGVKITRNAINFNKAGERGVYVSYGQKIIFKKLDIIYEGDDFVLSRNKSDSEYVQIHDKIVFEEDKALGTNSTQ